MNATPLRYRYNQPDHLYRNIEVTISASQILREYFPSWSNKMRLAGHADLISPRACIEDFCVVHWAWPVSVASHSRDLPEGPSK